MHNPRTDKGRLQQGPYRRISTQQGIWSSKTEGDIPPHLHYFPAQHGAHLGDKSPVAVQTPPPSHKKTSGLPNTGNCASSTSRTCVRLAR